MGFDEGRIILDNENGNYIAGQTVFGRIVFDQGKPKDIHGIYVSCKGFCKVHWTTTKTHRVNRRTVTRTVHHESYEEYFKRKHFIIGNESGEYNLKAGHHEYNFNCPIPNNCPSSFEGEYGHIRYRVKVVMVTSGIFSSNKEKKVAIKVQAPLDLNQNPICKEPIEFELNNTYCCWCISAGSSEVSVKLPVTGFCPGEVIPMEVSVANQSNVEIEELKFSIKQKITFEATQNPATKHDSNTVATMIKGPIPAHTTRNWQVDMEVPTMDTYNVIGCRYIDIEHIFKVSTEVSGCHEGSEISHPIIIGNIPLVVSQDMVHIPLHNQNAQTINYYPPPTIIHQPLPQSPYPNNGSPYPPTGSPYPPNLSPYPTTKHNEFHNPSVSPYPAVHMPQPSPNLACDYSGSSPKPSPVYPTKPVPPYPISDSVLPVHKSDTMPPYTTNDPAPPYPDNNSASSYPKNDNFVPSSNFAPPYPSDSVSLNNSTSPYPTTDVVSTQPTKKDNVSPYSTNKFVPPYPADDSKPLSNGDSVPPYPTGGSIQPSSTGNSVAPYPTGGSIQPLPTDDSVAPYPTGDSIQPLPTGDRDSQNLRSSSMPPNPTSETMPKTTNTSALTYSKSGTGNPVSTPNITSGLLKTGTIGFAVPIFGDGAKAPSMSSNTDVPYPTTPATNPYASATAPEPSTPGNDNTIPAITISRSPAYNPEFLDLDKETETANK